MFGTAVLPERLTCCGVSSGDVGGTGAGGACGDEGGVSKFSLASVVGDGGCVGVDGNCAGGGVTLSGSGAVVTVVSGGGGGPESLGGGVGPGSVGVTE